MSTVSSKTNCVKCVKGGTGIATCDGCHQSFCEKHLYEHRQEISQRAEQIKIKCQQFRDELKKDTDPTSALVSINRWEEESIEKIRTVANTARTDVEKTTHRMKNNYTQIINKISEKTERTGRVNEATEMDLDRWNEELQTLRKLVRKPFPVIVVDDENPSAAIRFIKVKYHSPFIDTTETTIKSEQNTTKHVSKPSLTVSNALEKFSQSAGRVTISDNKSVATFVGYSSVEGILTYSQGIHRLKIDVIDKKHEGIFFGIMNNSINITSRASELPSVHGWRDFDRKVTNGNAQLRAFRQKNIETGDQFTLIIDCEHSKLVLLHHQLKKKVQMSVDIDECPFPWKFIVSSFGEDVIGLA